MIVCRRPSLLPALLHNKWGSWCDCHHIQASDSSKTRQELVTPAPQTTHCFSPAPQTTHGGLVLTAPQMTHGGGLVSTAPQAAHQALSCTTANHIDLCQRVARYAGRFFFFSRICWKVSIALVPSLGAADRPLPHDFAACAEDLHEFFFFSKCLTNSPAAWTTSRILH